MIDLVEVAGNVLHIVGVVFGIGVILSLQVKEMTHTLWDFQVFRESLALARRRARTASGVPGR